MAAYEPEEVRAAWRELTEARRTGRIVAWVRDLSASQQEELLAEMALVAGSSFAERQRRLQAVQAEIAALRAEG